MFQCHFVALTFVKGIELVQHLILPGIRSKRKIGDIVHHYHKYFLSEFLFSIVKQEICGPFILRMFCHVHQLLTVYETWNSVFRRWVCEVELRPGVRAGPCFVS